MASPEDVARLKQGTEAWNKWRRGGLSSWTPDLSEANLKGIDLHDADLSQISLKASDLSEANLTRADLSGADLSMSNLSGTVLVGADLTGASLRNAILNRTVFGDTNLSGADLGRVRHAGGCPLDPGTVTKSADIPLAFLRGCGWPERLIEYWPSLSSQGIQFYSVFISYSQADSAFARRLHDQLQGRGIRVWRDEHEISIGDSIRDAIDHGIRVWDKVLLCCSEASLTSPWVSHEVERALQKEERLFRDRGERVQTLIPLDLDGYLFDGDYPFKSLLTERLAADFREWEDFSRFEREFERVVKAMAVRPPQSSAGEFQLGGPAYRSPGTLLALVEGMVAGDPKLFEEFTRLVTPRLLEVARPSLADEPAVRPEEAVEDVLVDLWKRRADLSTLIEEAGGSEAFLATVERWTWRRAQELRRKARSRIVVSSGDPAESGVEP